MFQLKEKVVYPGHGVAEIIRIIEKNFGGSECRFYELKFIHKDMTILVPVNNFSAVGLRKLSTIDHLRTTFSRLASTVPVQSPDDPLAHNWNRRNKKYKINISKGNLDELCKIYRDLSFISATKELSFGERNLLQQTETLLMQEVSLVNDIDESKAIEHLRQYFGPAKYQGKQQSQPAK